MTQKNKRILLLVAVMLLVMIVPMVASAQLDDPNAMNGGLDPDGNATPIDGGLSLLVAAGVGYGAKKMKERRNSK